MANRFEDLSAWQLAESLKEEGSRFTAKFVTLRRLTLRAIKGTK
jgi:hypothetical protein